MISHEAMHLAENMAHYALIVMAIIYTLRIRWFLRFPAGKERQAATGAADTTRKKGILYSLANIAMPWAMESSRTRPFLYLQFVLFHIGVVCAIVLSFTIPFAPEFTASPVMQIVFKASIGAAFVVGLMRIIRRIGNVYLRAISTPDDHFSLWLLTVWFGFAFFAVSMKGDMMQYVYFWMTMFFLLYVPFSKISHYLYYPFTRYYLGKTMGHRGVYPLRRGPSVG
jgi:nitrate reductase gamma subunit